MNIEQGDIVQLGNHKLICGDSTRKETYKKLIGSNKIDLVLTDPPYGVDYSKKNGYLNKLDNGNRVQKEILNDNIDDYSLFFNRVLRCWKPYLNDYNSIYIYISPIQIHNLINALLEQGYTYTTFLTWVKHNHVFGFLDYMKKTEPIIYGWFGKHKFYGGFNTDVLEYKKPLKSPLHPTMKPLKLTAKLMTNSSKRGMNVLDCFGGSGTTLLVAEKLNRNCFMVEKDPEYCDVIVRRWESLTGGSAVLF